MSTSDAAFDAAFRSTLAPEAEFVLLGARTRLEGARRARWEELLERVEAHALNWQLVLHLAGAHRVLGLLGRHLSARSWRDVPPEAKFFIQRYFQLTTLHSATLTRELADVLHHLESAGVPVVSFKGPTLAFGIYGNAVVRPSADLDLLVSRESVWRASEVLRAAGYAPEAELSPAQEQVHLRVDSVLNWFRPAPAPLAEGVLSGESAAEGFAVELHWAITSPCLPFKLDFEALEAHLTPIQLPGVEAPKASVRAIAPDDLLLILAVHGAKHLWERLIWLCDIAELIAKTPDLHWEKLMHQAGERGVLRMTVLALVLARDVLGVELPAGVQAWFSTQPEALRVASRLRASLLGRPAEPLWDGALTHNLSTDRLLMQTIDAPFQRLGFVWHLFSTPSMTERATGASIKGIGEMWWILRPARALHRRWLLSRSAGKSG